MLNLNDERKISNKLDPDMTQAGQNFYNEKMKNITEGGIYNLVHNLCMEFCQGKYKVNRYTDRRFNDYEQQKYNEFKKQYGYKYNNPPDIFQPPNFCGLESPSLDNYATTKKMPTKEEMLRICSDMALKYTQFNKEQQFEPFIFFEKVDPTKFSKDVLNDPKAIANYVKQFANYLSKLFKDSSFAYFLISSEKNIKILKQIIGSDFVLKGDKNNPELFEKSHLLDIGTSLVEHSTYYECCDDETEETNKNKKKLQPLILDYLEKSFAISNGALQKLLFDSDFYKIFAETKNINQIVIDAIKKTDFHNQLYESDCSSIGGLNGLLQECEKANSSSKKQDCFYNKNRDEIENALADKCAEIFADTKENVEIKLDRYFSRSYVCQLMSNCLSNEKNKESATRKKLINALKKWLDNDRLLLWEFSRTSQDLGEYISSLELFVYDAGLKKSFANACRRTIKHLIDKDSKEHKWNLMRCQEELENIRAKSKLFSDKFGIKLEDYNCSNEPYKTHGKNIALLSLWIFLALVCIVGTIILSNVALLTVVKIILITIVWLCFFAKIFPEMLRQARNIHDVRLYNAKLDIYKSKTKIEAKNRLSWGMIYSDEVKNVFNNKFPDVEQNNEKKNLPDI